jgi:hypothetical protein
MKLSGYSSSTQTAGSIKFPILVCWNPMTRCVSIAADVNGRRVLCRIPEKVVHAKFNCTDQEATLTVTANRPAVEAAATTLIQRKSFASDGMIDIALEDL